MTPEQHNHDRQPPRLRRLRRPLRRAAVDCIFGYTGRPSDDLGTGDQNNLNRWYEAITGKWLSEDPIPADSNLYRYCGNRPTNATDPYGLSPFGRAWARYMVRRYTTLDGGNMARPKKSATSEIEASGAFSGFS